MKKKGKSGRFSRRQKAVLAAAGAYTLLLVFLTVFSTQIQKNSLPGVGICYVRNGYLEGESYNTIVSEECICGGQEGTFVWLVTEKDTPLGKRLYVKRQEVEILNVSDGQCAISPILELNQAVAVTDGELEDGEQVILREDATSEKP
ncbi:MAG: hypothetical protein ACOX8B_04620 [Lachnospiraceae bacterium]